MRIGPFGVWEIMIILIVVLLIFGPRRLPEMAKGLGQSVRAFRKEMRDIKEDFNTDDWDDAPAQRRGASPAPAQARRTVEPVAERPPVAAGAVSDDAEADPARDAGEAGHGPSEPRNRPERREPVSDESA